MDIYCTIDKKIRYYLEKIILFLRRLFTCDKYEIFYKFFC